MKIDRLYSVHRKPCWSCIQRNITKTNTIGTTAAYMLREVSVFRKLPELRLQGYIIGAHSCYMMCALVRQANMRQFLMPKYSPVIQFNSNGGAGVIDEHLPSVGCCLLTVSFAHNLGSF